jgi:hypothetical protein
MMTGREETHSSSAMRVGKRALIGIWFAFAAASTVLLVLSLLQPQVTDSPTLAVHVRAVLERDGARVLAVGATTDGRVFVTSGVALPDSTQTAVWPPVAARIFSAVGSAKEIVVLDPNHLVIGSYTRPGSP